MKKIKKIFIILPLILAFIFESCKTAPILKGIEEPFGIIGDDADIYVYMPVEKNRKIVEQVLPAATGQSMKQALSRTTAIYSGITISAAGVEVRVCARGKYPYGMTDSFFKKKDGWNPKKTKEGYKYYESPYLDVSIPSPLIACMGLGPQNRKDMQELLSRMKKPVDPEFPEKFNFLINSNLQDIGIFVKNPDLFLSGILGVSLGLPLGKIEMYLKKASDGMQQNEYRYDLYIESGTPQTTKVAKMILQRALKAEVKVEENMLIVEGGNISEEKITAIIKSIYPN
ncbi:hypothetical protein [Treponema pedis]|uniref:hypothetical protein n=1 Tax=Treponema pedis TaxID=409322 RepID=UPI0020914BA1|nr:hypothetical protein [Treponema pedis]